LPVRNYQLFDRGRQRSGKQKEERMAKRIYVGNLSYNSTREDVESLFAQYGAVVAVDMIMDRFTGKPRGFCFVEMENAEEAIAALNGKEFDGRSLNVNEAKERTTRSDRQRM